MRVIEKATGKDKDEILKLYKSQLGRKYCPWNEDYPSMETIDFDLSKRLTIWSVGHLNYSQVGNFPVLQLALIVKVKA